MKKYQIILARPVICYMRQTIEAASREEAWQKANDTACELTHDDIGREEVAWWDDIKTPFVHDVKESKGGAE